MANVDFPSGLMPLRNRKGSFSEIMVMDCVTTIIYEHALAFLSTTGLVGLCSSSVVSAALAKKIVGVFAESKAAGAAGVDGSTSKIRVYSDPDQLYSIQHDSNTEDTIAEVIGNNYTVTGVNSGNATTLRSIMEINGTGSSVGCASSTNAEILQVLAVEKKIGNSLAASTSWTRFVVKLVPAAHLQQSLGGQS